MNKKKLLSILLIACLTVGTVSCSKEAEPEDTAATVQTVIGQGSSADTAGEAVSTRPELPDAAADAAADADLPDEGSKDAQGKSKVVSASDTQMQYALINRAVGNVAASSSSRHQDVLLHDAPLSGDGYISVVWEDPDDMQLIDVDDEDISTVEFLSIYTQGTRDKSVAYVQQQLMDLGFMEPAEPTEYYGSVTMEAVKLFQRQNDLVQDGIVGEMSLAMLINPEAKHYLAKLGMEGSDISRIQTRLYELGYLASKSSVTGYFGDDTEAAVKQLQSANGLSSDGKVGQMTTELMYSDGVVANLLNFGDKGEIVLACQQRLKELGYLTTSPDGNYGSDTLAAVKLFQSRNDLVVDGYLGPSTRDVLDSSTAVTNGLVIGDEGDTVKRVQELLIKYGYMSSGSATGYFGEVTDKAIKSFQRDNGLTADGNVGVKTMSKLTGGTAVAAGGSGGSGGSGGGGIDTGTAKSGSVEELLKVALSKVGCKYVYGAKGPNTFDCSGFVYWCLNQIGVKQSYITSYGWRTVGKYKKVSRYKDLKAGDIIVVTGHVGIIGENGTVIDASSSQCKIMHRSLSSWWSDRFICGWRIFD